MPRRLVGREHWSGPLPWRLMPIFRDRDELPSSAELGSVLNEALQQSRYLIVICSPQSARSRWVNEEVKYFKSLGRAHRVLPLIISGEPNASEFPNSGLVECLPPAIRFEVDDNGEVTKRKAEPIAADARGGKDGRATAKLKLIAGLIGVGLDELRQRERQRQIQRRFFAATAGITLTLLAGLGWHWQQNEKEHALQAQELKARVAQLYENGRQELLAHNEARAAVYLNEAYKLGVDTPALRYMLARSMRVVDAQVLRIETGSAVYNAALSPEEERLLVIDRDWRLSVWDARSGKKLSVNDLGKTTETVAASFSAKGGLIWVQTEHSEVPYSRLQIFDADGKRELAHYPLVKSAAGGFPNPVDSTDQKVVYLMPSRAIEIYSLLSQHKVLIPGSYSAVTFCSGNDAVIAGTSNGMVLIFDGSTGRMLKNFAGLRSEVVALTSSNACKTIAAGTSLGEVRVWEVRSGAVLMSGGHPQAIADIRLNPAGSRLMSYTNAGMNIWQGRTGALLHAEKFNNQYAALATMNHDGTAVASLRRSRLAIIDPISENELFTLDGHDGPPQIFDFSPSGSRFVTARSDGSILLWDLPRKTDAAFSLDNLGNANSDNAEHSMQVALNHQASNFYFGGDKGMGEIWALRPLKRLARISCEGGKITSAMFSPDDEILATGNQHDALCLWDVRTGRLLHRIRREGNAIERLSFSPDGGTISDSVREHDKVDLWATKDGERVAEFPRESVAQSFGAADSKYAFVAHAKVTLWDVNTRAQIWSKNLPVNVASNSKALTLAFSPDSKELLVTTTENSVFVLSAKEGSILQAAHFPSATGLFSAQFSPDGSRIVLGDLSKTIFVWQLRGGHILSLTGHVAAVRDVMFTPDSALIISTGADGLVKIWDAATGQELDSLAVHDGAVSWSGAQLSRDGATLLTGGTDGVARMQPVRFERRNAAELERVLRCRVAWRTDESALVPLQPQTGDCNGTILP